MTDFREKNSAAQEKESQFYLYYYVVLLTANAAMLSFYTVQAFTKSPPCLAKSGLNLTNWFNISF